MTEELPVLNLPSWAEQKGRIIYVETANQAFDVLDYFPEKYDPLFSVIVKDKSQNAALHAFMKSGDILD